MKEKLQNILFIMGVMYLIGILSLLIALPIRAVIYGECQKFIGIEVCIEERN